MNKYFLIMAFMAIVFTSCENKEEKKQLISKNFIGDDIFVMEVRGLPKEGSTGIARQESSKRGAVLNSYYYAKKFFRDDLQPDRDGRAESFTIGENDAVVRYVIEKKNIRSYLRPGVKIE